jgi:hypothetical protein
VRSCVRSVGRESQGKGRTEQMEPDHAFAFASTRASVV